MPTESPFRPQSTAPAKGTSLFAQAAAWVAHSEQDPFASHPVDSKAELQT